MANLEYNLLKHLKSYYDNQKIEFLEPPTRFGQGQTTTQMYRFKLSGIPMLSARLVLRLFSETVQEFGESTAYREGTIQNILCENNYPAPRAHIICETNEPLGGPFIIMDFMNGKPMLETTPIGEIPELLANAHYQLHKINPSTLIEILKKRNIDKARYDGTIFIDTMIIQHKIDWLKPAVNWIKDNEPKDRTGVICHGDFHPFNILIDQGKISAVLDWTTARIGEPERDVASTKNLLSFFGFLVPGINWSQVSNDYFNSYLSRVDFDSDKIEYYEALNCLNLLEGVEIGFINDIEGLRERLQFKIEEIMDLLLTR